jgi:surface antigen
MSNPNPVTQGISQQQAQWYVELLEAQSQSDAAQLLSGADTTTSAATPEDASFAALLSSALTAVPDSGAGRTGVPAGTGSAAGTRIAAIATQLAGDLRGANNQSYDPSVTPTAAQAAWQTPGWGNGNVQCVAFVDGVFRQAGVTLPATPNGADFWGAYLNAAGWQEVANGQGLPQPGDIIAFAGGAQGYGHVAVVTSVVPPANGQAGSVTFAQANSPTSQATLPIASDGSVQAWPGYQVQGYIRLAGG